MKKRMGKILSSAVLTMILTSNVFGAGTDTNLNNKEKIVKNEEKKSMVNDKNAVDFYENMKKSDSSSYIYLNENGTYSVVTVGERVYVQIRDADFKPVSRKSFMLSGEKFAGYYYDGKNYYIISANDRKKDSTEIYIVDKYNAQRKIGRVSITAKDMNIDETVVAGSVDIERNGNILSIVDSVNLRKTDNFGNQANILFNYDMEHMAISYSGSFGRAKIENYSTDKFAKPYVTYGHENYISICWKSLDGICINGAEYTNTEEINTINMFETYNKKSSVNNNITLDGFEASRTSYIVAGTSVTQNSNFEKNTDRNVFISTIGKTQLKNDLVKVLFLTNYNDSDKITIEKQQLVKIDDDNFVLLWQENKEGKTTVKYTNIDTDGKSDIIKENDKITLSNCKPIYNNGKLVWFSVSETGAEPQFYTIEV